MTTDSSTPPGSGLPDGFEWGPRWQHGSDEQKLELEGKTVAMLLKTVSGGWFARLECHWPISEPLVVRPCSSFEAGKAGCEAWARRHADRLRREIAQKKREKPLSDGLADDEL
ncbi:hypothetical protein [Luteimonas sp. MHLX1A]|uniref:hypothetical protein n=1 Tax=Alterluteimonas muca TaxID=2878684 RepID=UPI001E416654|nr:hypothetical protein [Luteimonas sp. MHLX1A]MCD9046809.1 hypothetical protein [Luteimonas sp. MHLX1A]